MMDLLALKPACIGVFLLLLFSTTCIEGKTDDLVYEMKIYEGKSAHQVLLDRGLSREHISRIITSLRAPNPPDNATIPLLNFFDNFYYAKVQIGTPAQDFNVFYESTWADTLITSKDCPTLNPACWFHNQYDSDRSSTYIANGTYLNITGLPEGKVEGILSVDKFGLGQLNITNQTFGEMSVIPQVFALTKADGILGIGRPALSYSKATPIFYNGIKLRRFKKNVISIFINNDPTNEHIGTLVFGGMNPKHYNPKTLVWMPLIGQNYWAFNVSRITLSKSKVKGYVFCDNDCSAILDTGGKKIQGPSDKIKWINRLIGANKIYGPYYEVPCSVVPKIPRLNITISTQMFSFHGRDLVSRMHYKGLELCISVFEEISLSGQGIWVFGGAFLQRAFTVFDPVAGKIGFAQLKNTPGMENGSVNQESTSIEGDNNLDGDFVEFNITKQVPSVIKV